MSRPAKIPCVIEVTVVDSASFPSAVFKQLMKRKTMTDSTISPAEANLQSNGKVPFFKFVVSQSVEHLVVQDFGSASYCSIVSPLSSIRNDSLLEDHAQEKQLLWLEFIRTCEREVRYLSPDLFILFIPTSQISCLCSKDLRLSLAQNVSPSWRQMVFLWIL